MSNQTPTTSSSHRQARKAKPSIESLVDGRNTFLYLHQALEAAKDEDTVAVIPPDGSDIEEFAEDVAEEEEVREVAGLLEVIRPGDEDVQVAEDRSWRSHVEPKQMEEGPRIITLSESHPLLATLSPLQLFQLYYTKELSELIAIETQRYARQSGDMTFEVSPDDIDKFVVLLLYSSYVKLPRQEMYWQRDFDIQLKLPQQLMSRQRFRDIKKYIHFSDNDSTNVLNNRFAKVQPLLDHLNSVLIQFGILYKFLSVDEEMVRFHGRHTCKQYMRAKPIKWGFKQWVVSDSLGYPYHVSPYQGASLLIKDKPLGYRVVMSKVDVIAQFSDLRSHELFMDNFFTSYDLLRDLHDRGLRASGIIRNNRICRVPLKRDTELRARGDYHCLCDGVVRLIRLHDSKVITLATNFDTVHPLQKTKRMSKTGQEIVQLPRAFRNYNDHMGAVDLTNRFVVDYEPIFRGKKWYWPLFVNCLSIMRVASWRLSAHIHHGKAPLDQLSFLRSLVQGMATTHRREVPGLGPAGSVLPSSSLHLQVAAGKQGRCRECRKTCKNMCRACNIMLHNHCSSAYHKD
jgi:DNA excision repair protein ERCC-6